MIDIEELKPQIIERLMPLKPDKIILFGSYAYGTPNDDSDIDILVRFRNTPSLFDLARIHRELSNVLGKKVDVVTEAALKNKKLKHYIYNDLKIIFE